MLTLLAGVSLLAGPLCPLVGPHLLPRLAAGVGFVQARSAAGPAPKLATVTFRRSQQTAPEEVSVWLPGGLDPWDSPWAMIQFPEDGALSLEYEENPKDPIKEIEQCLEVARAAAKKAAGG